MRTRNNPYFVPYAPGVRDTSGDRVGGKGLRRLPICLPPVFDPRCEGEVLSWFSKWKRFYLAHWFSPDFRGRISIKDYARLHGVSPQAVLYLARHGKLGDIVQDASARRWVRADQPYPERATSRRKDRKPDGTVRAIEHTDFRIASAVPTADELADYARTMGIAPRTTLEQEQRRIIFKEGEEIRATNAFRDETEL